MEHIFSVRNGKKWDKLTKKKSVFQVKMMFLNILMKNLKAASKNSPAPPPPPPPKTKYEAD